MWRNKTQILEKKSKKKMISNFLIYSKIIINNNYKKNLINLILYLFK